MLMDWQIRQYPIDGRRIPRRITRQETKDVMAVMHDEEVSGCGVWGYLPTAFIKA
jgi:hypothetical protein